MSRETVCPVWHMSPYFHGLGPLRCRLGPWAVQLCLARKGRKTWEKLCPGLVYVISWIRSANAHLPTACCYREVCFPGFIIPIKFICPSFYFHRFKPKPSALHHLWKLCIGTSTGFTTNDAWPNPYVPSHASSPWLHLWPDAAAKDFSAWDSLFDICIGVLTILFLG